MDHLDERDVLKNKRKELKKQQEELIHGLRNVVTKRAEVGNRLEDKVRSSHTSSSPDFRIMSSPKGLQTMSTANSPEENLSLRIPADQDSRDETSKPS